MVFNRISDRKKSQITTEVANKIMEMCAIKLQPLYDRCTGGVEEATDWAKAVAIAKLVKDIAALTEAGLPDDALELGNNNDELTDEEREEIG